MISKCPKYGLGLYRCQLLPHFTSRAVCQWSLTSRESSQCRFITSGYEPRIVQTFPISRSLAPLSRELSGLFFLAFLLQPQGFDRSLLLSKNLHLWWSLTNFFKVGIGLGSNFTELLQVFYSFWSRLNISSCLWAEGCYRLHLNRFTVFV